MTALLALPPGSLADAGHASLATPCVVARHSTGHAVKRKHITHVAFTTWHIHA